jgi:hypothetical protein
MRVVSQRGNTLEYRVLSVNMTDKSLPSNTVVVVL